MTTLLDSTLEVRCVQYRREFHMPAFIDPTSRRILLRIGTDHGAITMPADLGEQVLRRLLAERVDVPVVEHPRAKRWTFVTAAARPDTLGAAVSAELFRMYATVACAGSQVVLPSPEDERTGYRTWVQPPEHTIAPPALERVVAITRELGPRRRP